MIAVNPFLGLSNYSFDEASKILMERGDFHTTMPLSFYIEKYSNGKINEKILQESIGKNNSLEEFIEEAKSYLISGEDRIDYHRPTIGLIDLAEGISGKKINDFIIEKLANFAAAYFDENQALWQTADKSKNLYSSWKLESKIDRSYELFGMKDFNFFLSVLPEDPNKIRDFILNKLDISENNLDAYLHGLLLKISGWGSYIAGIDYQNKLEGKQSNNLENFLTILLTIEFYFYQHYSSKILQEKWITHKNKRFHIPAEKQRELEIKLCFQEAMDKENQSKLEELLIHSNSEKENNLEKTGKYQAVFCIDVRSEIYRRNLERTNPDFETLGFAGFFGFPVKFTPHGKDQGINQCPALIAPPIHVKEKKSDSNQKTNQYHQKWALWNSFKSGAFSSFGFVSMAGISFLPELIKNSFGLNKKELKSPTPQIDLSDLSIENKVELAYNALNAMGLKNRLGKIVLIVGHGSSSTNNPQASGLDCGACGGNSGTINALIAENILNDLEIRTGLKKKGCNIPKSTVFLAALHNTTLDTIEIFHPELLVAEDRYLILSNLEKASKWTAEERIKKFDLKEKNLVKRALNWSEIRPEWGLAGCHSFIIGPREWTKNLSLNGQSFLHNYDWRKDDEFKVLETILTAPMVVTSWINLQYFGSTTDPLHLGAGSKTLHNVVGGIGVVEGSGGDLRIGLSHQSVHNGKEFVHQPLRLQVFVKAPKNAIETILDKHPQVRELIENKWIFLNILDDSKAANEVENLEKNFEYLS